MKSLKEIIETNGCVMRGVDSDYVYVNIPEAKNTTKNIRLCDFSAKKLLEVKFKAINEFNLFGSRQKKRNEEILKPCDDGTVNIDRFRELSEIRRGSV